MTNNCKKTIKKIATRTNFLMGLFTTFKVIETVIFKKMYFKNVTKMAVILDLIPLCQRPFTS